MIYYFKQISNNPTHDQNDNDLSNNTDLINNSNTMDERITPNEINKAISTLKNDKSSSSDKVLNEYIKYSKDKKLPVYVSFFNIILDTGIIPSKWSEGVIIPIYKNKGKSTGPENYRPITQAV